MDLADTSHPHPELGPAIELRELITRGRANIREIHQGGAMGEQVTAALTSLCDRIVERASDMIAEQTGQTGRIGRDLALVAVGGYGRGDLAPFSDVDLLFLTAKPPDEGLRKFVSAMVRLLWDAGLSLSQSVRTPAECFAFARSDLPAWTALTEARLIRGSDPLFEELLKQINRLIRRRSVRSLAEGILDERKKELTDDLDSTVYLLEPSVKKSAGGLRDYHLIRWVGRTRYGTPDPMGLHELGHLSLEDREQIIATRGILLRIRNELHFDAGSAQDIMTLDEQQRLSGWLGWSGSNGLLPVERFMQDYYRHTTTLHEIALRFARQAWSSRRRRWASLLSRRHVDGMFVLERHGIRLDYAHRHGAAVTATTWMQLFELARCHDVPVDPSALEQARISIPQSEVTTETRRLFFQALDNPVGLGRLLRDMHNAGLLERLIPPFQHVRCLIQFNHYHKYTVDEHTIRVVEAACRRLDDKGPIGAAYRQIRRKDLLHLILLMHDVGKGYPVDHSEKGAELAETVADQFELSEHDREMMILLIRHHLLMANIAQRRDLSDAQTIVQFARMIGTPEVLLMLFVLTAADTEAVGPGNLTSWKEALLIELYTRAMQELTGQVPGEDEAARAQRVRDEVTAKLPTGIDASRAVKQLDQMPAGYLLTTEPARIYGHLRSLQLYRPGEINVTGTYDEPTHVSTYTVILGEGERPGIFANISGVLAAAGFQILSAQIVTRPDGVVIDTFETIDNDWAGAPPPERHEQVARNVRNVLIGERTVESLMGTRFAVNETRRIAVNAHTQVEIDNSSSDRFTIVDVFATDRQGLLYVITGALAHLGFSIHSAKIATHVDQVVDAFYVTRHDGSKETDSFRLTLMREELVRRIDAHTNPS